MNKHARVVVIGGGNMGASVLYHLALEGWTDCLLIEKAELTSGATWHAAGLVSRMVGGQALGQCHDYAIDLYKRIEAETEQSVTWHSCGSIRVASSEDHRDWLLHTRDGVLARGQTCDWLEAEEIKDLNPLYDISSIVGGLHTPDDGHVDPAGTCQAMARGARQLGAEISRRNRVVDLKQRASGEWEVVTEQGTVIAEQVVNAGGYHARQIGAFVGLDLPIVSMQHHYLVTDDVPELDGRSQEIPVTRDDYFTGYLRQEQRGVLIGLYDSHDAVSRWLEGCPWDSENELFEPDMERMTPWLERCFERFPGLVERGIKRIVNGAITYTPDGAALVGPAPGLRNHWLACGATAGIAWGPGLGKYLAQWIVHGAAEISMRGFDPRRFGAWDDYGFAVPRTRENYMTRLMLHFPQDQYESCRGRRRSGAHQRTEALGALYEEAAGWERPRLYAPADWYGKEPNTWRRGPSHKVALAEARAVSRAVGLGDFSAFAQFEISGPGAESFLNPLCANRMPTRPGGTCLTVLLNRRGLIEGEATVARLGKERFWFVAGGPSERRLWDWLTLHQRGDEAVDLKNRSGEFGLLTLAGPKARAVLSACTEADLSNASFAWRQAREIQVGGVPVIALRLSYTGLLAWEFHAPNDRLGQLWDVLWAAGKPLGITPFGSKALDMLRMEKAYRGGQELSGDASPLHAGSMRFVRLDKNFLGCDALLRRAEVGETSVAAYLAIEADDCDVHGGEAVFHEGQVVGSVTSGAMGPVSGKSLAFAFVQSDLVVPGTGLEVSILGDKRPASVLVEPLFDPENALLKADEAVPVTA